MNLEEWSKADLIKLVKTYAKNWLAHDGCWFLAAEELYDLEKAIKIDKESWRRFTVIEAKRIMKEFSISSNSDLNGLKRALELRLYASINTQEIEFVSEKELVLKMKTCRVQAARERKNLEFFPCKSVGIVEYTGFANTINPSIKTECIACPPDKLERDFHCGWKFSLH
ncbi:MAG: DUF6125 family protein [Candidatus Hodarchaeales archaeon]|jgi:hypothetical protein